MLMLLLTKPHKWSRIFIRRGESVPPRDPSDILRRLSSGPSSVKWNDPAVQSFFEKTTDTDIGMEQVLLQIDSANSRSIIDIILSHRPFLFSSCLTLSQCWDHSRRVCGWRSRSLSANRSRVLVSKAAKDQ